MKDCALFIYSLQRFLSRSRVKIETALQALQPIRRMIALINRWNRICTHLNLNAIPPLQFTPMFAVKGHRCCRSGIVRHKTSQYDVVRKHHGAETQYMWTNRSYQNTRNSWMDDRSTSRHAIRCRARGSVHKIII